MLGLRSSEKAGREDGWVGERKDKIEPETMIWKAWGQIGTNLPASSFNDADDFLAIKSFLIDMSSCLTLDSEKLNKKIHWNLKELQAHLLPHTKKVNQQISTVCLNCNNTWTFGSLPSINIATTSLSLSKYYLNFFCGQPYSRTLQGSYSLVKPIQYKTHIGSQYILNWKSELVNGWMNGFTKCLRSLLGSNSIILFGVGGSTQTFGIPVQKQVIFWYKENSQNIVGTKESCHYIKQSVLKMKYGELRSALPFGWVTIRNNLLSL